MTFRRRKTVKIEKNSAIKKSHAFRKYHMHLFSKILASPHYLISSTRCSSLSLSMTLIDMSCTPSMHPLPHEFFTLYIIPFFKLLFFFYPPVVHFTLFIYPLEKPQAKCFLSKEPFLPPLFLLHPSALKPLAVYAKETFTSEPKYPQ